MHKSADGTGGAKDVHLFMGWLNTGKLGQGFVVQCFQVARWIVYKCQNRSNGVEQVQLYQGGAPFGQCRQQCS